MRQIAIYLAPVVPRLAQQAGELLQNPIRQWSQSQQPLVGSPLQPFQHMLKPVDPEKVKAMVENSKDIVAPSASAPSASAPSASSQHGDSPQPLLDEPLAALDAATRVEVRRELRRHLTSFSGSAVLVTHDPVDAYTLADRVVIVEQGHVVQDGTFVEIAAHPRSAYVAELVGVNLLTGSMMGGGVFAVDGGATLVVAAADVDGPAIAVIRPQAVSLHATRPEGSPRNAWMATVIDVDHRGDRVRVRLQGPVQVTAEITSAAADALHIKVGLQLWAAVKATEIAVTLN